MGTFDIQYTSGSLPPLLVNVNQQGPIRITLPTSSVHSASFNNSYITNTVSISGSNNAPISIQNSTLGSVLINANSSGSNSSLTIGNSLIVGGSGSPPGIFMSQSGGIGTSRFLFSSMMIGSSHTASLDAVTGSGDGILNVGLVGVGLFVSGTAPSTVSTSTAGMFVGAYNETSSFLVGANTRSLADPTFVKFAVGAGNSSTRLTALWVSSSGQTFSRRGIFTSGSGTNPAFVYTGSVQGTGSIDILSGSLTLNNGAKLYTGASTGSIGEVLKRTANGVEWQSDNSGSTIDTGSLATTGSNTFRGTETISGSIYLNTITGSGTAAGPLFSNFTQSGVVSGFRDGGNLFMFRNSSLS